MSKIIHLSDGLKSRDKLTTKVTTTKKNVATPLSDSEINALRAQSGWLSVKQFATLSGNIERNIQRDCKAGKYAKCCRQIELDGRRPYQLHFAALPPAAIMKYKRLVAGIGEKTAEELAERDRAFRERSAVTDYNADRALKRHVLLKEYQQWLSGKQRGRLLERKASFCERYNRGGFLELEEVRQTISSVSWKTLDRWQQELDKAEGDPYGIATKYGKRRDVMMVSEREATVLTEFALHPNKLTYAEIVRYSRQKLEAEGYPVRCSDSTLQKWVKKHSIENAYLHSTMRDGEKALNDHFLPSLRRNREALEVGDILVADGHTLNFTMRDPVTGKPKRMTLVLVFDFMSGMPVGWEFAASESTAVIAGAYHRAVQRMGFVMKSIYIDNGRAFNSKYFTHRQNKAINIYNEREFIALFDRLKPYGFVGQMNAVAYHGQSKPIERFFGTMHQFEKQMPTYLGNSIENRVASESRNEKLQRELRERMMGGAQPEVTEVNAKLMAWFEEYATTPQSNSSTLAGRTPLAVYQESLALVQAAPEFAQRQIADADLRFLMMAGECRTVRNSKIRMFGREYYAPELFGYKSGEKRFVVRYDLLDPRGADRVFVFDERGETFICEATDLLMSGHHPSAKLLGTPDDQRRLDAALGEQKMVKSAAIQVAKTVIASGFYDAVASQEAQVVPSMRELEQRRKAIAEVATGTDGDTDRHVNKFEELQQAMMKAEFAASCKNWADGITFDE